MKARMLKILVRRAGPFAILLVVTASSGCSSMGRKHEADKIPQLGVVDPHQPRELHKSPFPPYVIEPPDELEIAIRPPLPEGAPTSFVVQPDGFVDLGFSGDVFVAGLTLSDAEERIALHLDEEQKAHAGDPTRGDPNQKYEVSVRLANNQSKFFYVLGAVGNQGRFKCTGNETVLDAVLQAGLRINSLPDKIYVSRPHLAGGPDVILKVDWFGVRDRGDTVTNYQTHPRRSSDRAGDQAGRRAGQPAGRRMRVGSGRGFLGRARLRPGPRPPRNRLGRSLAPPNLAPFEPPSALGEHPGDDEGRGGRQAADQGRVQGAAGRPGAGEPTLDVAEDGQRHGRDADRDHQARCGSR